MIPTGEVPCVWMTAGVLSYRLCDRELRCSRCPLDRALRNTPGPGAVGESDTEDVRLPADVFYHPGHTWVRILPRGVFAVGIDDLAARLIGRVEGVRRPGPEARVVRGAPALTVLTDDDAVDFLAPFDGTVTVANDALADRPELLVEEPFGDGWAYRALPANPTRALAELLPGRAAACWARLEEARLADLGDVARAAAGTLEEPPDRGPLSGIPPAGARRIRRKLLGRTGFYDMHAPDGRNL